MSETSAPEKSLLEIVRTEVAARFPQADLEKVEHLRDGGSGSIYKLVRTTGETACLKINKCTRTAPTELAKTIREAFYLCRSSETQRVLPVFDCALNPIDKTGADQFGRYLPQVEGAQPDFQAIIDDKSVPLVVFEHQGHHHVGFVTPEGCELEHFLEYLAQASANPERDPDVPVPPWVEVFNKFSSAAPPEVRIWANGLLPTLIRDLLNALDGIHSGGLAHLDVKEENVLAFPPSADEQFPRFLIFDFGSARELHDVDALLGAAQPDPQAHFETTYHYLPQRVQRHKPLSRFTSHKRTPIEFWMLAQETLSGEEIDLHAVSRIIENFLVDRRFRHLSAYLGDDEYETAHAFAQLISSDFRDIDADSLAARATNKRELARRALERLDRCDELAVQASNLWQESVIAHPALANKGALESIRNTQDKIDANRRRKLDTTAEEAALEASIAGLEEDVRRKGGGWAVRLPGAQYELGALLSTPLIARLKEIRQLALTHMNPPDYAREYYASHTRLEHAIGVVEIARLYLLALLRQSGWLRLRYQDEDGIHLLMAALLHDVGHYPCAHYLGETGVFHDHEDIGDRLIAGDVLGLNLHTAPDREAFDIANWKPPSGESPHWPSSKEMPCGAKHAPAMRCPAAMAAPEDILALHEVVGKSLLPAAHQDRDPGEAMQEFASWYSDLSAAGRAARSQPRLALRLLGSVVSGPIDADKVHYLVNDALYCDVPVSASFERLGFERFLRGLRVAIRERPGGSTQRFCLGLDEQTVQMAQAIIFMRAGMYRNVYWSTEARSVTAMLHHLLVRSIELIATHDDHPDLAAVLVARWMKATDEEAAQVARELAEGAERHRPGDELSLVELYEMLFSPDRSAKFIEVCRIHPSNRVAFQNVYDHVRKSDIEVGNSILSTLDRTLLREVRDIVVAVLGLEPSQLPVGAVLIDAPAQRTSKRREFARVAIVDRQGFGRSVGDLWQAIESDFEQGVRVIRVFMKPVRRLAREEQEEVRDLLLTRLS